MFNHFILFYLLVIILAAFWNVATQSSNNIKYGILIEIKFRIVSSQGLSIPSSICVKSVSFDKYMLKVLKHEY